MVGEAEDVLLAVVVAVVVVVTLGALSGPLPLFFHLPPKCHSPLALFPSLHLRPPSIVVLAVVPLLLTLMALVLVVLQFRFGR